MELSGLIETWFLVGTSLLNMVTAVMFMSQLFQASLKASNLGMLLFIRPWIIIIFKRSDKAASNLANINKILPLKVESDSHFEKYEPEELLHIVEQYARFLPGKTLDEKANLLKNEIDLSRIEFKNLRLDLKNVFMMSWQLLNK